MKCTAIKLSTRVHWGGSTSRSITSNENYCSSVFTGNEGNGYEYPFLRKSILDNVSLAITTINLPDQFNPFNTGASLERWSKKRARFKSAKISKSPTEADRDFCYETLETDFSLLLNDDLSKTTDGSLGNLEYHVHADIEELLLKSQRSIEEEKLPPERISRRRKKKKNKVKIIKLSKPSSPETEQIIRVDVTSIASEETKAKLIKPEEEKNDKKVEQIKELKRSLTENEEELCDEDIIVKCRQLDLKQRRKKL